MNKARTPWPLIGIALLCSAAPAAAELKVKVSKTVTGKWESVGITVTDPRGGAESKPGPLAVTMADGRDRRQTIYLEPGPRPGEWSGRFTPLSTGRFTGTAILEREHGKDIGLVPLITVRASGARGFVKLHPRSKRAFQYDSGGTLFPIPLRLHADDLVASVDWQAEIARMRAHDVNFLEIPVPWPNPLAPGQDTAYRTIDQLLLTAERTGRMRVMLRLEAPPSGTESTPDAYREQVVRWVRRWAYSPALAVWYLSGADESLSAAERSALVKAARAATSYRHLVAVPESGEAGSGADLPVARHEWQRPRHRFALLEADPQPGDPEPLAGEDSWQSLVVGGIGLPIRPYRPGAGDTAEQLRRIREIAQAAGKVPYQATMTPLPGVVPPDVPGAYCRYATTYVAWGAADSGGTLPLPRLPAGRYELLMWDPATYRFLNNATLRFDHNRRQIRLPGSLETVYFMLRPAPGKPSTGSGKR